MAVHAQAVLALAVPAAGAAPVNPEAPVPQFGPVALAAQLVGLAEAHQPSAGEPQHVAVARVVTAIAPLLARPVHQPDARVLDRQVAAREVEVVGPIVAARAGEDVLGERRQRHRKASLVRARVAAAGVALEHRDLDGLGAEPGDSLGCYGPRGAASRFRRLGLGGLGDFGGCRGRGGSRGCLRGCLRGGCLRGGCLRGGCLRRRLRGWCRSSRCGFGGGFGGRRRRGRLLVAAHECGCARDSHHAQQRDQRAATEPPSFR